MLTDTEVYVDMSAYGRPEAQIASGSADGDGRINITAVFPDAANFTGVFEAGVIAWDNATTWIKDL